MPDSSNTPNTHIVTINNVALSPIEFDGQRVVTLAMVDEVHQRPSGTARRNFNANRDKLIEGKHFHELTADEIRSQSLGCAFPPRTPKGIVLTERGYLMLTKSLQDDLAWKVQDMLVESYFTKTASTSVARRVPRVDLSRECRLTQSLHLKMAKMAGLAGNQALIAANRATAALTGVDSLALMGITYMDAPQNEALLSPTDIGMQIGSASARTVNLILTGLGLQTVGRDHKGHIYYEPTAEGVRAGGVMQDTGKKHGTGTPIRQLRWASSVVNIVEDAMRQDHAA